MVFGTYVQMVKKIAVTAHMIILLASLFDRMEEFF
jgi:hypothetical protein